MKPEHKKILLNELLVYNWKEDGVFASAAARIIDRIEALQGKPRMVLSDEQLCVAWDAPGESAGWKPRARSCIAAEHALQLEPVMQKATVRIFRNADGDLMSSVNDVWLQDWTIIDTIEKEYPV